LAEDRATNRDREQRRAARETTRDGSRHRATSNGGFQASRAVAIAVAALALAAAALLVASEFSTVAAVDVASGSCEVIQDTEPELADRCELTGFERNGGALLPVAALVLAMGWGTALGRSRPAALALVLLGIAVLAWALLVDLPVTRETGSIGNSFAGARGEAGAGLKLELAGGALALVAGLVGLAAPGRAPRCRVRLPARVARE